MTKPVLVLTLLLACSTTSLAFRWWSTIVGDRVDLTDEQWLPEDRDDTRCDDGHPAPIVLPPDSEIDTSRKCDMCASRGDFHETPHFADRSYDELTGCYDVRPRHHQDEICAYLNLDDQSSIDQYVEWCKQLDPLECLRYETERNDKIREERERKHTAQKELENTWQYFFSGLIRKMVWVFLGLIFLLVCVGIASSDTNPPRDICQSCRQRIPAAASKEKKKNK